MKQARSAVAAALPHGSFANANLQSRPGGRRGAFQFGWAWAILAGLMITEAALAKPRQPGPPWPEASLLFRENFDQAYDLKARTIPCASCYFEGRFWIGQTVALPACGSRGQEWFHPGPEPGGTRMDRKGKTKYA